MEAWPYSVVMYGCLLSWLPSPSNFQCLKDSCEHFKSKYWLPQPWTLVSNCVWPQPIWRPSPVTLNLITKKQGRRESFWERQQQHIPGSPGCRAGGNRSPATCFRVSLRPWSWLPHLLMWLSLSQICLFRLPVTSEPLKTVSLST